MLAVPTLGWVNLHFSLLPAWRGAAPVQHAILAGDEITGATTFALEEGLDTGPVFGTITQAVRPTDTSGDLLARLAESFLHDVVKPSGLTVHLPESPDDAKFFSAVVTGYWNMFKQNIGIMIAVGQLADAKPRFARVQNEFRH